MVVATIGEFVFEMDWRSGASSLRDLVVLMLVLVEAGFIAIYMLLGNLVHFIHGVLVWRIQNTSALPTYFLASPRIARLSVAPPMQHLIHRLIYGLLARRLA